MTPAAPRIRILYVHHRGELGGAPESLAQLIRSLDRARFEPHVYCPPGAAARLFAEAGATVHTGTVAAFTHVWASTYRELRWLLLLRELTRLPGHVASLDRLLGTGFDIVHLNDSPLVPAAYLARRRGVPVIWHLRSAPGGGIRAGLVRTAILRFSTETLAINRDVSDLWRVPAVLVPNPVDLERFRPGYRRVARARLGLPADGRIVSYVGFLYPAKGAPTLLLAAGLLRDREVEAGFVIAGGAVRPPAYFRTPAGRLLQRLGLARDYEGGAHATVAALGLDGAVRFLPFTREVEEVYRASDLVVAPSQGPEIGRSLLEAAATGVAAVGSGSTTGGGVLKPGVTTVFATGLGPEPLADAIGALLADPARRDAMGAAARLHALATFDAKRIVSQVEAVYERAVSTIDLDE